LQQLVLCSSLGTETPDAYPSLARILRQKRLGELAIIQSGIPYTIVRPSGLTNAPANGKIVLATELTTFGMISREDVAEVLVQALLQPQARYKVIEITSRADGEPSEPEELFAALAN
ncbi:MAG: NAD(P)H-binding protein, partial [Aggregatilineales bacterium]